MSQCCGTCRYRLPSKDQRLRPGYFKCVACVPVFTFDRGNISASRGWEHEMAPPLDATVHESHGKHCVMYEEDRNEREPQDTALRELGVKE